MTAREKIGFEFRALFDEFCTDVHGAEDKNFGIKYGIVIKPEFKEKHTKKTIANAIFFQSHVFSAYRTIEQWESCGFDRKDIWQLTRDGFLAETMSCRFPYKTYYYIPQKSVRTIMKEGSI